MSCKSIFFLLVVLAISLSSSFATTEQSEQQLIARHRSNLRSKTRGLNTKQLLESRKKGNGKSNVRRNLNLKQKQIDDSRNFVWDGEGFISVSQMHERKSKEISLNQENANTNGGNMLTSWVRSLGFFRWKLIAANCRSTLVAVFVDCKMNI